MNAGAMSASHGPFIATPTTKNSHARSAANASVSQITGRSIGEVALVRSLSFMHSSYQIDPDVRKG